MLFVVDAFDERLLVKQREAGGRGMRMSMHIFAKKRQGQGKILHGIDNFKVNLNEVSNLSVTRDSKSLP